MKYIYNSYNCFFYNNNYIAKYNDIITVEDNKVKINSNVIEDIPAHILESLLNKCIVYTELDGILNDEISSKVLININKETIKKLISLGILRTTKESCQDYHIGKSNYSEHVIQPWHIWQEYDLNPFDADIVKRVLRTKSEEGMTKEASRIMDYEKIIHVCNERIRQLKE